MDGLKNHMYETLIKPMVHKEIANNIYEQLKALDKKEDKLEVVEIVRDLIKGYRI